MSEPTRHEVAAMLRLFNVEPTKWRVDHVLLLLAQRRMTVDKIEAESAARVNDWATNNANALQTNGT